MSRSRATPPGDNSGQDEKKKVRLDKWLWAARWYKTRVLASAAIKGGKIRVNDDAIKPAYQLAVNDLIAITQGPYRREIRVLELGDRRGPATQAATLFTETENSLEQREKTRLRLKAQPAVEYTGQGRPTKRDRRQIIRFTDNTDN
ncbi:MAG: RNA-binding S4 domain-containing protein [Immundisolibacteraceae bacterium]|nr:RNA-binding S4 domain-containing protein [Immundisolibacteraceae bacterium]